MPGHGRWLALQSSDGCLVLQGLLCCEAGAFSGALSLKLHFSRSWFKVILVACLSCLGMICGCILLNNFLY
ncbi:MAG: hypothetical protein ACTSXH_18670 [Promethearchaeota archaeon]